MAPLFVAIEVLGFFIGIAVTVFDIILCVCVSKAFGRQAGTAIGLFFLSYVFTPILGYGEAKYVGNPNAPKEFE